MDGCVVGLYIARAAGAPMLALTTAHLVPGRGIVGDRSYTRRSGAVHDGQSDVTLVSRKRSTSWSRRESLGNPLMPDAISSSAAAPCTN